MIQPRITITSGIPIVLQSVVLKQSNEIVCIEVALLEKNYMLYSIGRLEVPQVLIGVNIFDTVEGRKTDAMPTNIEFSEYAGWQVFSAHINQGILKVVLIK